MAHIAQLFGKDTDSIKERLEAVGYGVECYPNSPYSDADTVLILGSLTYCDGQIDRLLAREFPKSTPKKAPNLRKIGVANCCANCLHLAWGPEEGWDVCGATGIKIAWGAKQGQVCDLHERTDGDPRKK